MGKVQQVTNKFQTDPYQTTKTVTVEPSEESKATSLSMPTDPATLAEIERQKQAAARAYGVDPKTGQATPFEVLGYNPEEERKRREAERALNDAKRKENAWYNAFAVLGDSLTAALGGNVWSRQPNNIGAKANADNARLIAEQKAEDEANQGKLRAASAGYADAVNKLIQNYLTKTVTTSKTGGGRTETTNHPAVTGFRLSSHVVGDGGSGSGSGSGGRGGKGSWKNDGTYQIGLVHNGTLQYRDITGQQAKNIVNHAETLYEKAMSSDEGTRQAILDLLGSNIVQYDDNKKKYTWDDEALLRSGYIFEADKTMGKGRLTGVDKTIRDYYREITGDTTDYSGLPKYDLVTPAMRAIQEEQQRKKNNKGGWGIVPGASTSGFDFSWQQ